MNPMNEIGLIVARELRKNLRSAKGIVLLILSLLGGTLIALVIVWFFQKQLQRLPAGVTAEQLRVGQDEIFTELYGDPVMGHYLGGAPLPLVAMLFLSVWLAPALIALAGFDAISGEVQNRTVRYWTVRVRRTSYFFGKFLGIFCAVSVITFLMNALMWAVTIARGSYGAGDVLSWGIRFWLVSLPISMAWCGIATFIGSLFRTPILGLLTTFVTFFVFWFIGFFLPHWEALRWLQFGYPNFYDGWLMSPHPERIAGALAVCMAIAALPLAAGTMLFRRRDV